MLVKEFKANESDRLSASILEFDKSLSYNAVQKIIRSKDVKVNGKRVSKDILLKVGDNVQFYVASNHNTSNIIYNDDNIVVASKPKKIETSYADGGEDSFEFQLESMLGEKLFAVHRLDRNTDGLVVFAKNQEAKNSLDNAFKNRTAEKYYLALVFGHLSEKQADLVAYLKKDSNNSFVQISDTKLAGYEKIETKYKLIEEYESSSLIEVELVTGKTHQIRAHLAHIGHFVIGDQKYGDSKVNREYTKKYQCLTAYKIVFHFEKDDVLYYLNNKEFKIPKEKLKILSKNK